ncbi:MAG: SIS domain-containing protein [Chloroflexi bacterium]|nr:SIS domain-containing protein [Chloroflexota bacterium]
MKDLDDPGLLALDASGMFGHIEAVGREFVRAWEASLDLALPPGASDVASVVIAGMGGSATAGDYFAAICASTSEIPVTVVRGTSLPNYVSDRTLVVVCSYSGDTGEALACYDDAWKRGAALMAITRGGRLGRRCHLDGVPAHTITYNASPRATTVHTLAPLLRLGTRLGISPVGTADIRRAGEMHHGFVTQDLVPTCPVAKNGAKQLALALHGRFPIVFGAEHLERAAARFRNQLAENGKSLGAFESLPEADHNLIVGLERGGRHKEQLAVTTLESPALYSTGTQRRFELTCSFFEEAGIPVHRLAPGGTTVLEQLLLATAWGDYVSCYVALLEGIDPTPIPQIDRLKAALAE